MAIPAAVVYFVGYESIRESLKKLPAISQQPNVHQWAVPLIAGSTARIIAVTMISPIELLKTKMQHRGKDGGVIPVAREILSAVKNHGPGALYRGLVPTLWRDVPFSALYWAGYENFKSIFKRNIHLRDSASNNFLYSFMAGALSGMIAAALTTPFDVAKTRQQVALHRDTSHTSKSIGKHLMEIWRTEGLTGITRGIGPRVGKVAPSCAIMVGAYEFGKSYLSSNRRS
jgi:solute carrier family 25 protein 39/40